MRVCFLIDNLAVGGTEKQLLGLISGLVRANDEPYLCLLDGTSEASQAMEPGDCPVMRLGVTSFKRPNAVAAAWRFFRFLRRERIDVVQLQFRDSTYFGAPLARLAGVAGILRTRRDLGFWMRPVDRWLGRGISRVVSATVVNSATCGASVIADEGAAEQSIHLIPNGVDFSRFAQFVAAPHEAGATRRIGVVANLRPVKNLELFVRAAARLATKHADVEFEIAGEGECRPKLTALAAELGIADRFHLRGQLQDIPAFLAQLSVAVLPSDTEGLSNAIIEYMAAGRPIVATDAGGIGELVMHGETGLVIPRGDELALTNAMDRLLSEPAFAADLGRRARAVAEQRWHWDSIVERYRDLYWRVSRKASELASRAAGG